MSEPLIKDEDIDRIATTYLERWKSMKMTMRIIDMFTSAAHNYEQTIGSYVAGLGPICNDACALRNKLDFAARSIYQSYEQVIAMKERR